MRVLKRAGAVRLLALVAALAAGVFAVSSSLGSSHREAPGSSIDPTGDDTDLYAFTASDAPGSITVVANWIPFEDPAGGPNFYRFDDRASYYVNVDNTGDGAYDVRYRFKFKTRYRNPKSFLYALPGVTSFSDPKLQQVQTYSVTRERYDHKGRRVSAKVIGHNLPVAPNNVGPKTIPNYDAVANGTIRPLAGGGKVFAGQREDPFFVDLGATFDAVNLRKGTGNEGGGKDDLAGYNVHSVVLQVPEAAVTVDGKSVQSPTGKNAVVGVWASTERPRVLVSGKARKGGTVQVSRLGNPLVNEVVIPVGQKDMFNATQPKDDAKNYAGSVVKPELAAVLNALFKLGIKETDRTDIVTALLTGVPGVTQIGSKPAPADTLKLNLGVPPTATPNRFGVIGGDNAGFPNGRRLGDDVVDIELRVIGGFLIPANQGGKQLPLGDGVDQNDRPFQATFPYVASPFDGFDSKLKRSEPAHNPTPGDLKPPAP
jgi:Domain of unknown function (DUF4331)